MQILNNKGTQRLGDALKSAIDEGAKLSIISSYFTIHAFGELKEELEKIDELRFIFSEPTFVKQMNELKDPRYFEIEKAKREQAVGGVGLELNLKNNLNQRALARQCATWVRDKCKFASAVKSRQIQPGGTYVCENPNGENTGFMGAVADFTLEGLGYENKANSTTAITQFEGVAEVASLKSMFESVWQNKEMLVDVTSEVAQKVETLYRENSPEFVYFLTLHHLFKNFLEDADNSMRAGINFENSVVWNKLYDFQKDGVKGAIRKLEKYRGCIIADSVGLGKTFEALAIMKYYQERNDKILVLCPKRLRENWTLWKMLGDVRNPLSDDRLNYTVLNHTDLSRKSGMSGDVSLENLNWSGFDLIVIDESHNFRNKTTQAEKTDRYTRLIDQVIKSGVRSKVLMLSATPVNNKMMDLRNQIELITEGDDEYLSKTDRIPSISQVTKLAQKRFKEWSGLDEDLRTTDSFLNAINSDYFKLLDVFTIARSRKHIQKYYGAKSGNFPERLKPISFKTEIDLQDELPSISVLNDEIKDLKFAQYQLLDYVLPQYRKIYEEMYAETWGKDFWSQVNRSNAVANLMRVNMLKRLESSVNSFKITLEGLIDSCTSLLAELESSPLHSGNFEALNDDMDDDDADELKESGEVKVDFKHVDTIRLAADLDRDVSRLSSMLEGVKVVTPERDAKLNELFNFISKKASDPFNEGNKKVLVFSSFSDTTKYLFECLAPRLKEKLGLESAEIAGTRARTHSKLIRQNYEEILRHFSPVSKELNDDNIKDTEIEVVFATDCISEGQNLQDCDCVVNYDIHWNPVRIIQRFGRVDRLGSKNKCVQLVNFWPNIDLDEYIQIEDRVKGRMMLLDVSSTGEENVLKANDSSQMNDLSYRKQQLKQLQEEVLDLEDIKGGISVTDFTFDDFKVELERFMADNPGLLEKTPFGLHCVVNVPEDLKEEVSPGIIFCLKQNDETRDMRDQNPTSPYYVAYVSEDAETVTSHTTPKQALDLMRAACAGKSEPILELCKCFNKQTADGTKMQGVGKLLSKMVENIEGVQESKGIEDLFTLGEVGSSVALTSRDFSLVSFVVLK